MADEGPPSPKAAPADPTGPSWSVWIDMPREVCRYFRRGLCQRVRCHFFHGSEAELYGHLAVGARYYRPTDGAARVDPPPPQGPTQPPAGAAHDGKSIIACRAFQVGKCTRERCRFVHLRDDVRHTPRSVCAYYASSSGCKRGAGRCAYFHGPAEELRKMHERGVALFNPLTNEPYDTVPENIAVPTPSGPATPDSRVAPPAHHIAPVPRYMPPTNFSAPPWPTFVTVPLVPPTVGHPPLVYGPPPPPLVGLPFSVVRAPPYHAP